MATKHFCDGCDAELEEDPLLMGHVAKREYCAACAEEVKSYLHELDTLHEALAQEWTCQTEAIRRRYKEIVAALPDQPA